MTNTNGSTDRGTLPTVSWTVPPAAMPTGGSNLSVQYTLRLLRNRWWLLLVGLVPTVLMAYNQVRALPETYESVSSFVVRPVEGNAEQLVRAMDTLLRGVEINTTYANVVGSRVVTDRALERLDLGNGKPKGLDATGQVVTGTNIVEIRTTAQDPELAQAFGEAVAAETVAYIDDLQNAFGLVELDPPTLPTAPVGPRVRLTVMLSAFLGGLLGLGLLLVSGIAFPLVGARRMDIVDPLTGAHTGDYLLIRLRQELARIHRHGGLVSVAVVDAVPRRRRGPGAWLAWLVADKQLARTAAMLRRQLEETDVVAHVGGGRFVVLAPERAGSAWLASLRLPGAAGERPIPCRTIVGRPDRAAPPLPSDLDGFLREITEPKPAGHDGSTPNGAVPRRLPTTVAGR
ncbi:hypothetical protein [Egicoccus sp. AB-alg2]|uniref:hypothetical protein n=1 Tax=Egicoccus sp. AB-alg2 TaxID=3242693 RepID=UPI00359DE4A1